jgi:hypothetical protein
MAARTFKSELLAGHKEDAVEVPFDPTAVWNIPPKALWRGRRGHTVKGELNGHYFESFIVPRSKRFYLIIDAQLARMAGVTPGDRVSVILQPH